VTAEKFPLRTLAALCCLSQAALTIYLPSATAMATAFNTDDARIQLLVASFMLPHAAALPFIGPISDRFGRRPAILGGLLLFLVASFLSMVTPSFELLLFARGLQGVGACAMLNLPRAVVRDRLKSTEAIRALTLMVIGQSSANIMAPVIGGFLHDWFGWQGSFGFATILAALLVIPTLRLPETATGGGAAGNLVRSYTILLSIRRVVCNVLTNAFHSAAFYAYIAAAPAVFMSVLGLSVKEFSLIPLLWGSGYVGTGLVLTNTPLFRADAHRMIIAGNVICLAASGIMAVMSMLGYWHPALMSVPAFFMGMGQAFCMPRNYTIALVAAPVEIAGASSGLIGFAQYIFGTLAALATAAIPHASPTPLALIMLGWTILALLAYLAGGQPGRNDMS
jgi:DHA1 family bicyclomycin/chloramphenicol resistance-like MFS transporter